MAAREFSLEGAIPMRSLTIALILTASWATSASAGPFAPQVGQSGSTAIANTSPLFVEWASGFQNLVRGPINIANPALGVASFGSPTSALGPADGNATHVVSLGDGGQITLTFAHPITDGPGPDLAVFENGFPSPPAPSAFLELGFVEVSTNGTDFVRFPARSLTQTATQVGGGGTLDASNIDNLAGKYIAGFGTPFDLSQVAGLSPAVDVNNINFVRIIDVVGSIDPALGTRDSLGNLINDPYPTPFASCGFDLNGVGVIHDIPEPNTFVLIAIGAALLLVARRRWLTGAATPVFNSVS
jgi:hypothetical protein